MAYARTTVRKMSAGVILVDRRGRVLMQLRDDDPKIMFAAHWGLTGGAGVPGETADETARREVLEETGLRLSKLEPFRAYYFHEVSASNKKRGPATKRSADYELYLFHAPCTTPAEELVCGEGRELRFFAPDELEALDIAYNHREVLSDFFASPTYSAYIFGGPFSQPDPDAMDPLALFLAALDAGDPWFEALMDTIARWERPEETVADGRIFRYLVGGEAFDWLLLAERLIGEAGERIPAHEAEQLLFRGIVPAGDESVDGAVARLSDDDLRSLLGDAKHRAHLNYLYGVTVEEALQYAVELEVSKESRSNYLKDQRTDDDHADPVYQRIYGETREALLARFREQCGVASTEPIALSDLREFMYWLFKYRVAHSEPARVASDTRKALAQLAAIEFTARRRQRVAMTERAPEEALAN